MFKGLVILSAMLNVALVGGAVAYWVLMPEDAEFMVSYNKKNQQAREVIRDADKIFSQSVGMTRDEFQQLLINDQYKRNFSDFTSAGEIQELLVESIRGGVASQNTRLEHENASVERFAMRRGEYRDFERDLTMGKEQLRAERESFERTKKEWEDLQLNTFLNQIVADIDALGDDNKIGQKAAGAVKDLPTIQQAYILRNVKNGLARIAIEAGLPDDQRAALKNFNARVNSNAGVTIGSSVSAGS